MHATIERLRTYPPKARRLIELTARFERRRGCSGEHAEAVSRLAVEIGLRLGLNEQQLADVELGALLHDVGKLEVPEEILAKPAALDEDEWRAMRGHSESGERLLHRRIVRPGVLAVVRWHHERWDGSGYPDGKRREEIPVVARVVAVADAFQAMTEHRPYRLRRTPSAALEEVRRHAGTQFDPDCVDALAAVVAA
jgi:HD-GYP domain-containing protein (c-di-GMP phosphodiesterase class II)